MENCEVTFEVNPKNATLELFELLYDIGVNRINIGVESFDDKILHEQCRLHTALDAVRCYELSLEAGLKNINLDFIYGLPNQTLLSWEDTLAKVAVLHPPSFCAYCFRLKKGTPNFKRYTLNHPRFNFSTEDEILIMHIMTMEAMAVLGYKQKTVDWFIREDSFFHTYQQINWQQTDQINLIGLGPSAYSYLGGWQYYNINDLEKYKEFLIKNQFPIWRGEFLSSANERMRRAIFLGLKSPISRSLFFNIYGCDIIETFRESWEKLIQLKLVTIEKEYVYLTYLGQLFADEIGQKFYSSSIKYRMDEVENSFISTTSPIFNNF